MRRWCGLCFSDEKLRGGNVTAWVCFWVSHKENKLNYQAAAQKYGAPVCSQLSLRKTRECLGNSALLPLCRIISSPDVGPDLNLVWTGGSIVSDSFYGTRCNGNTLLGFLFLGLEEFCWQQIFNIRDCLNIRLWHVESPGKKTAILCFLDPESHPTCMIFYTYVHSVHTPHFLVIVQSIAGDF